MTYIKLSNYITWMSGYAAIEIALDGRLDTFANFKPLFRTKGSLSTKLFLEKIQ